MTISFACRCDLFSSVLSYLQCARRSRAIAKYIAVKARAGNLIALESDPAYFKKVALYEQAIFVETTNFERFGASLMYECLFKEVSVSWRITFT